MGVRSRCPDHKRYRDQCGCPSTALVHEMRWSLPCPVCGAAAAAPCVRADRAPMRATHSERIEQVIAQLRARLPSPG